jgi:hypothetical protein
MLELVSTLVRCVALSLAVGDTDAFVVDSEPLLMAVALALLLAVLSLALLLVVVALVLVPAMLS